MLSAPSSVADFHSTHSHFTFATCFGVEEQKKKTTSVIRLMRMDGYYLMYGCLNQWLYVYKE